MIENLVRRPVPGRSSQSEHNMSGITRLMMMLSSPILRGGQHGMLSVLIYHRVTERLDSYYDDDVDAKTFEIQMALLAEHMNVLSLDIAIELLKSNSLPPRAVVITFDDGYRNNFEVAMPILEKYGLTATFFIATGYLDGGCMWNDKIIETVRKHEGEKINLLKFGLEDYVIGTIKQKNEVIKKILKKLKYLPLEIREQKVNDIVGENLEGIPEDIMMTSAQVKEMSRHGMQIGAHTVNHPILARLDEKHAEKEIYESKMYLEQLIGNKVNTFAYPNGKPGYDYNIAHVEMLKKLGFQGAVSTAWGVARRESDVFQIPRFLPWAKNKHKFFAQLLLAGRSDKEMQV